MSAYEENIQKISFHPNASLIKKQLPLGLDGSINFLQINKDYFMELVVKSAEPLLHNFKAIDDLRYGIMCYQMAAERGVLKEIIQSIHEENQPRSGNSSIIPGVKMVSIYTEGLMNVEVNLLRYFLINQMTMQPEEKTRYLKRLVAYCLKNFSLPMKTHLSILLYLYHLNKAEAVLKNSFNQANADEFGINDYLFEILDHISEFKEKLQTKMKLFLVSTLAKVLVFVSSFKRNAAFFKIDLAKLEQKTREVWGNQLKIRIKGAIQEKNGDKRVLSLLLLMICTLFDLNHRKRHSLKKIDAKKDPWDTVDFNQIRSEIFRELDSLFVNQVPLLISAFTRQTQQPVKTAISLLEELFIEADDTKFLPVLLGALLKAKRFIKFNQAAEYFLEREREKYSTFELLVRMALCLVCIEEINEPSVTISNRVTY